MKVIKLECTLMNNKEIMFNGRSMGFLSDDEIKQHVGYEPIKVTEINMIGYKIQYTDDIILGKTKSEDWLVRTSDGIIEYSSNELKEIYNLDVSKADTDRLTWTA